MIKFAGILPVFIFTVIACKDEPENDPEDGLLVQHSLIFSYPASTIQVIFEAQMILYPQIADIRDRINHGVNVYKVTYKTHYRDSVIHASGLVCLPSTPGSYPVISFQNGTNTAHAEAPSIDPDNSGYLVMEFMASTGYAILIPDYIGFGASSDILHPYYHKETSNNAVLDLLKAFIELGESESVVATGNDSLFLMGYSQGGWATLAALESMEDNSSLNMNVIAASAGAGAYNLTDFSKYVIDLESFPSPMYMPYFIYSHHEYGNITGSMDLFFKQPYAGLIPGLFDGSHSNNDINNELTTIIPDLIASNLISNFETASEFSQLRETLVENSISGWNTTVKINLFHGTEDDNVPPQQSLNLYNEFTDSGSGTGMVQYFPMEGLSHGSGLMPWGILTFNWFNSFRQN